MKNNKFAEVISLFTVLCIVFACCTLSANAAKENNIEYTVENNQAVIEKLDATGLTRLEIPQKLGGCDVVYLSQNAIVNVDSVTSITIPAGIEDLGEFDGAPFYNMNSLEEIIVDTNNQYYSSDENGVLYDKSKTTLVKYPAGNKNKSFSAPASVVYIKSGTFNNCRYLESVESLGKTEQLCEAFTNCKNLKKVNIPESVKLVNENNSSLFYGCDNLTDIYFGGSRVQWKNLEINADNQFVKNAKIHFAIGEKVTSAAKVKTTASKTTEKHTESEITSVTETESITDEIKVTEKTELSVSNENAEQAKPENNILKYIVPVIIVLLIAVGVFLVRKYKK